jgi:hypothetical protein
MTKMCAVAKRKRYKKGILSEKRLERLRYYINKS